MKRLLITFVGLLLVLFANAAEITEKQAFDKATQFMKGKLFAKPEYSKNARRSAKNGEKPEMNGYYIFNVNGGDGFVVVAGDDRMPDILGYSERGSLSYESAPDNVKWLLDLYEKTAELYARDPSMRGMTRRASKAPVRPLITTTWGQGAPYNDQCPTLGGENCITGCVATAMAQVINYNRWPQDMTSKVAQYVTDRYTIVVPALEETQFVWDNMQNEDIARLMRYCGQAVQMDYGTDESGAIPSKEPQALIKVFGYSSLARYVEHSYYSDEEWENLLYNELASERPIVYNGFGNSGGHTFVVHGYENGRFYINWGWNGAEDGYFVLTGLETSVGSYSSNQTATIGIQPPSGSSVDRPQVIAKGISWNQDKFQYRSADGSFSEMNVGVELASDITAQQTLETGLALYDDNGLKTVLWEGKHEFLVGGTCEISANVKIGSDVAQGDYRLVPVCRSGSTGQWIPDANASDYYIKVALKEKYLTAVAYPLNGENRNIVDVDVITSDGIVYSLYEEGGLKRAMVLPGNGFKYKGQITLPDEVSYNGNPYKVYKASYGAFQNCTELESLSAAMPEWPYLSNCTQLKSIEMREGVVKLANSIESCDKLESIEFPASLSVISNNVVNYCSGLKSMRFKNSEWMEFGMSPDWSAERLPLLTDVYFAAPSAPQIRYVMDAVTPNASITIHVPQGSKGAYESSDWKGWKIADDMAAISADGVEWGYCNDNNVTQQVVYDMVGNNDAEYAIHVPADMLKPYVGKKISRIKYYQVGEPSDYVFVTTPGTDYLVKQSVANDALSAWVTVELPEPYVITGDELYVGIGNKNSIYTALSDIDAEAPDGFWFRMMGTGSYNNSKAGTWINVTKENNDFNHPIPLKFVITGDDLPGDIVLRDVRIEPVTASTYKLKASVISRNKDTVGKYVIGWTIDGTADGSQTISQSLGANQLTSVTLDISADLTGRNHELTYSVKSIDDKDDALAANSSGTVSFYRLANTMYPRRIVMEEGTGTWCGACVHGTETIDLLSKEYPDNFIGISIHYNDELSDVDNYNAVTFKNFPSHIINRLYTGSAQYPAVKPVVEQLKDKAEAKVTATAQFAKRDSSAVTVTTQSVMGFSEADASNIRLAYVVVEDHTGPYKQSNSYSGQESFEGEIAYMEKWGQLPSKVLMEHHNVARALYGGKNGIEGSIPSAVKEGESYEYTYSFILPDNIQDKKNIRVIALLMDAGNGEILNACQTTVSYDEKLKDQTFDFTADGKPLLEGATLDYYARYKSDGDECTTSYKGGDNNLSISLYDGQTTEGKVKIEILENTMNPGALSLEIGGDKVAVSSGAATEMTFHTQGKDTPVNLSASGMQTYGTLKAMLTVTVGSQTQSVDIVFTYGKQIVGNVQPKDGEVWWNNHDILSFNYGMGGSGLAEHYQVATYIPADYLGESGTTVDGFAFRRKTKYMKNVKVWVATKLPDTDEDVDLEVVSIPDGQLGYSVLSNVFNEVKFEKQHAIPDNGGLYVGYSFDMVQAKDFCSFRPIPFYSSEQNREGAFWVKTTSTPRWIDRGITSGKIIAKVLMGGNLYNSYVQTTDFGTASAVLGGKGQAQVILKNNSSAAVNEVTINVKGNVGSVYETNAEVSIPAYEQAVVTFDLNADYQVGADDKTIVISKVNGKKNIAEDKFTSKGKLLTLPQKPLAKPVMEWTNRLNDGIGYVKGIVAFKKLKETFGSDVILIAVHELDVMGVEEYNIEDIFSYSNSLGAYINRGPWLDVYGGRFHYSTIYAIDDNVKAALDMVAPGNISVSADWADTDKTILDIKTETQFDVNIDDAQFQIGYVIMEDGLTGTGDAWAVTGYNPSDVEGAADFEPYAKYTSGRIEGLKYNDVPVACYEPWKGVEGTVPQQIKSGERNGYTFKADLAGNTHIQNKENLSVVVFLLDKNVGRILNAAKCKVGVEDTGIHSIPYDNTDQGRYYNLQGQRVENPRTGLYIINGKKLLIK